MVGGRGLGVLQDEDEPALKEVPENQGMLDQTGRSMVVVTGANACGKVSRRFSGQEAYTDETTCAECVSEADSAHPVHGADWVVRVRYVRLMRKC